MKKVLMLIATIAMSSQVMAGVANGKGSEAPKNGKGAEVPAPVAKEMCKGLGYEYGPGDLACNRNWIECYEAETPMNYVCDIVPELIVNVAKLPFYTVQEGVKMAVECIKSDKVAGVLFSPLCAVAGGLKGFAEGVVGTTLGAVEFGGATYTLKATSSDWNAGPDAFLWGND